MSTCDTHVTESGTLAFRVALSVLRHREDAEDVAQEAVVRSLQRFDSLKDQTRFRAWLVRIAWRLALDRRRSDTRRAARDFRFVSPECSHANAEHQLIGRERADRLWAAIDQLPPRLRMPLVLGTLQGRTVEEVATLLDIPVGTVKSRMFEARQRLKRTLIGTGVFIALGSVLAFLISMPRVRVPETPPVVSRIATTVETVVAPRPMTPIPAPPSSAMGAEVVAFSKPAPIQVPVVSVSSVVVKTVEVPVVVVPVVRLHVVAVPDAHQEK